MTCTRWTTTTIKKKLTEKKKAIEGRTLVLEGHSLRDTARNIDSKKYESKFGIVHEAQQDLLRMSESMMNSFFHSTTEEIGNQSSAAAGGIAK